MYYGNAVEMRRKYSLEFIDPFRLTKFLLSKTFHYLKQIN